MSLDITKLENVDDRGSRLIARCPACAEQGSDNKGDHLLIDDQGRFSCVRYPGDAGSDHRKRIFALVGINNGGNYPCSEQQKTVIRVKAAARHSGDIIKSNILGHLGQANQTLNKQNEKGIKDRIYNKDFENTVPSVLAIKTVSKTRKVITETEVPPTVTTTCSKCGSRAIPYLDSSGRYIVDKCNTHGTHLKVTHADIVEGKSKST